MVRTEKELVEKHIELSSEFSRYVFEHPEIEEKLASEAEIVFVPEYDEELREYTTSVWQGNWKLPERG
jgi:hypothetical protein